jgi:hypothetical protein
MLRVKNGEIAVSSLYSRIASPMAFNKDLG